MKSSYMSSSGDAAGGVNVMVVVELGVNTTEGFVGAGMRGLGIRNTGTLDGVFD